MSYFNQAVEKGMLQKQKSGNYPLLKLDPDPNPDLMITIADPDSAKRSGNGSGSATILIDLPNFVHCTFLTVDAEVQWF